MPFELIKRPLHQNFRPILAVYLNDRRTVISGFCYQVHQCIGLQSLDFDFYEVPVLSDLLQRRLIIRPGHVKISQISFAILQERLKNLAL